jgi:hypothetical protein
MKEHPATGGRRYIRIAVGDHSRDRPRNRRKIFDPCSRQIFLQRSRSGDRYSIIRKHGGLLHGRTGPEGSTFAFYLPQDKVVATPCSLTPLFPLSATAHLVMDDESAIRELTAQLLDTMGYSDGVPMDQKRADL